MSTPPGQTPEVHERKYSSSDWGPDEDTSTFYKGTPAPGERRENALPVARRQADDAERMPRKSKRPVVADTAERLRAPALALAALTALSLATMVLVFLGNAVYQRITAPPAMVPVTDTRTATPPDGEKEGNNESTATNTEPTDGKDGTWKGLRVKKGLR